MPGSACAEMFRFHLQALQVVHPSPTTQRHSKDFVSPPSNWHQETCLAAPHRAMEVGGPGPGVPIHETEL